MTARQLICIGSGLATAIPTMLAFRAAFELENNMALAVLMITLAPFAIFAFFEKDGLFFEDILRYRLRKIFYYPRRRIYIQENRYEYMIWAQKQIDKKNKLKRGAADGKSNGKSPKGSGSKTVKRRTS